MSIVNLEKLTLRYNNPNPNGDDLRYQMYPVTEVSENQEKPAFSVSPPGVAAKDNILLGIQGQTADIPIEFVIYNDGTDRSLGDYTTPVITVAEQIEYLREEIHAPEFAATWSLTHQPGGQYNTQIYNGDEVYLERMNIPTISNDEPAWKRATMRLRRGGIA